MPSVVKTWDLNNLGDLRRKTGCFLDCMASFHTSGMFTPAKWDSRGGNGPTTRGLA